MGNVDDAIRLIRRFIDVEWDFHRALYGNPDDDFYSARRAAYAQMGKPGFEPELDRPPNQPESFFTLWGKKLEMVVPRTFFQVKTYDHPTHGTLYRCYASAPSCRRRSNRRYAVNFFVAESDDAMRIIATYTICPQCLGLAKKDGTPCTCALNGWEHCQGVDIGTMGTLQSVRKLTPPDADDSNLQEYFAE